ncbi:hypothetical protein JCM19046_679 [Bacillus sp. JCM 19046]|nr:hypothetical protein JCM19046_679 [Bacillus sp. JCM 19046]
MSIQEEAVEIISAHLKKDERVQAIFLKGSMGRDEHDAYSDVDLYVLVDELQLDSFLNDRLTFLETYRSILFYEDYFIIAPQIIAVFDNLLHIDLFTVTEQTFTEKDFFKVVYDPNNKLQRFEASQSLNLTESEFSDHAYDTAWFLFKYNKAQQRGNDVWAVDLLRHVYDHFAKVLMQRYQPDRAQLGLKVVQTKLPAAVMTLVKKSMMNATPTNHRVAAIEVVKLLEGEMDWIEAELGERAQAAAF